MIRVIAASIALALTGIVMSFFFFNDTATTEIYTLSLHDALPIYRARQGVHGRREVQRACHGPDARREHRPPRVQDRSARSEEHTSELQSQSNLVCRLLLEKKKTLNISSTLDETQEYELFLSTSQS